MDCPCKKTDCPRHGNCEECMRHHMKKGKPPKCEKLKAKEEKKQ
ncbi:MAG: hypothetical protein ACI4NM_05630 [Bullifex sp.]